MEVSATAKYVRMSPRRGRAIAREVAGLGIEEALAMLAFMPIERLTRLRRS